MVDVKLIAFYLPQFHPIPENDQWWGKGFTEWRNVVSTRPLFPGHYQPHLPEELGFYDLRLAETRQAQAELAEKSGIHAFCYYHYWFHGRRLLHRPLDEVLASGEPSFPFLLCWANEPWTRTWTQRGEDVIVDQRYSEEDHLEHLRWMARVFADPRYFRIEDKPVLLVYRASHLSDPLTTTRAWREEARGLGLGELFLCRVESSGTEKSDPAEVGFDAAVEFQPDWQSLRRVRRVGDGLRQPLRMRGLPHGTRVYAYDEFQMRMTEKPDPGYLRFPCVTPGWDNTPRRQQGGGVILHGSTPERYGHWLNQAISHAPVVNGTKIVFVNAWNEWAEGNHLEPDLRFGSAYLDETARAVREL